MGGNRLGVAMLVAGLGTAWGWHLRIPLVNPLSPGSGRRPRAMFVFGAGYGIASAPEIAMVDFDGQPVSLEEYRGTPVVLNFWASWCPFCIAEMPDFERVSQSLGDEVVFLGVNLQDDRSQAVRLAAETGVTYRLASDPDGVVYGAFGGSAMPTTVFIDADGTVREVVGGQLSASRLASTIERHFGSSA